MLNTEVYVFGLTIIIVSITISNKACIATTKTGSILKLTNCCITAMHVNIKTRLAQICFKSVLTISLGRTFLSYLIPEIQSCIELFFNKIIRVEKIKEGANTQVMICNNKNTDGYKFIPYEPKAIRKTQKKFITKDDINNKFLTIRIKYL